MPPMQNYNSYQPVVVNDQPNLVEPDRQSQEHQQQQQQQQQQAETAQQPEYVNHHTCCAFYKS